MGSGSPRRDTEPVMSQENVGIVRSMFDMWNRGDFEGALAAFDSDVEVEIRVELDLDNAYHGRDELAKLMRSFWGTFSEFRSEPVDFASSGDQVVARVDHRGRGRSSRVEVEMTN